MQPRLWIDLDNSPHVPLFTPVIRRLRSRGWEVFVTARDFAQTLDLVAQSGLDAVAVGAHAGRSKVKKVANLPVRALQLMRAVRRFAPELALSHGSRTQAIASRMMGIPKIAMFDYEWTEMRILQRFARWLVCPAAISPARLAEAGIAEKKIVRYHGFKEEIYLADFRADPGFRASIGVAEDQRLITIRPPGLIGNYHEVGSEVICTEVIVRAVADPRNVVVILPKTRLEGVLVERSLPPSPPARVLIPERALPGLDLLAASDIAISGGGTMNREAALLGVPTYSIFTGRRAAVDEVLERDGLMKFLATSESVDMIDWEPPRGRRSPRCHATLLDEICGLIDNLAGLSVRPPR